MSVNDLHSRPAHNFATMLITSFSHFVAAEFGPMWSDAVISHIAEVSGHFGHDEVSLVQIS